MAKSKKKAPKAAKKRTKTSTKKVTARRKAAPKTATRKKTTTKKTTVKKTTAKKAAAKKPAAKKTKSTTAAKRKTVKTAKKTASRNGTTRKTTKKTTVKATTPVKKNSAPPQAAPKRRVQPLKPQDIETFRELLLAKRREISGDMSAMRDEATGAGSRGGSELSSMPLHMADLGTDNFERELTLGLMEGERAILREIDEALDRIREGTYGRCLATDKPIGKARLKAQPWAKYCYEYMLEQERGRRFG